MKRFTEQLKKRAESVRLRTAERDELRERIIAYMEYHPLPKSAAAQNAEAYIQTESYWTVRFNTPLVRGFVGVFAVLVLIIVPVVAEQSVPGDVLYPVKVNFNEEIRSGLAVSPYAKVEWETERLERRIAEARLLAQEGRLTEDVEARVALAVKAHTDAAQQSIAKMRENDSDEAAIAEVTFESALTVQSEVLEAALRKEEAVSLTSATKTPGGSVSGLAGVIAEARENASANQSGVTPSYERLAARVELETSRIHELFESIKESASEAEVSDIERRLSDIERKIKDAAAQKEVAADDAERETGTSSVRPGVALLLTALSDLQKLISFMTDIDVRENVTIDELVPITLTDEERTAAVLGQLAEIDVRIDELGSTIEAREADERTEKLETGFAEALEFASTSRAALAEEDIEAAEKAVTESRALLSDVKNLLGADALSESEDEGATTTPPSVEGAATNTDAVGTTTNETAAGTDEENEAGE